MPSSPLSFALVDMTPLTMVVSTPQLMMIVSLPTLMVVVLLMVVAPTLLCNILTMAIRIIRPTNVESNLASLLLLNQSGLIRLPFL